MPIQCGFVMDPITTIKPHKEATLAMIYEAQTRHHEIYYMTLNDLFISNGAAYAQMYPLSIRYKQLKDWYHLGEPILKPLLSLDYVIMRKDPPVTMEYIYATYILELAEKSGVFVVNKPQGLRDFNEKIAITLFPDCCVPTLVSKNKKRLNEFVLKHGVCVLKLLDNMGGEAIFYVDNQDVNKNVIIETLTLQEQRTVMAQVFIPEVYTEGSRRIILVDGEPLPYVLARIPPHQEIRGNIVLGAKGVAATLTPKEKQICARIKPVLKAHGLLFVGIDVIGDYLTEINVTSVGILQETDVAHQVNTSSFIFDAIEEKLKKR